MTGIRRPNRRRVPAILEATSGEVCLPTRKLRYLDRRSAELAARELTGRNRPAELVEAYRCAACGDWHIGHAR